MMTPHETEQYGQVLRVSVVREIFSSRISARASERSKTPSPSAPPTAAVPLRNVRRSTCMGPSSEIRSATEGNADRGAHGCQEAPSGNAERHPPEQASEIPGKQWRNDSSLMCRFAVTHDAAGRTVSRTFRPRWSSRPRAPGKQHAGAADGGPEAK